MPAQLVETTFGVNQSARTTTYTSPDLHNRSCSGVVVVLSMTSVGTGNVTVQINGRDKISGATYLLLQGAAVSSNGVTRYTVAPSMPNVANVSKPDVVPEWFQLVVTANNANPCSYSLGAVLVAPS